MLETTYITLHGLERPNPEIIFTKDVVKEYVKEFDLATVKTLEQGTITREYNYYYDQLKVFAKLYPNYNYIQLGREYSNIISHFYYKPKQRRNR